ncbi:MAG: hypothetical protein PHH00_01335 [Candidatus Nanoarchaeia archaeon]|nr:hypothetical protein [Candidatus Nanoarchaeia archaeon]
MAVGFDRHSEDGGIDIDKYGGQWVLITDGDAQSGRLAEFHPDRILLMPFQAVNYHNSKPVWEIQREGLPLMIYKADIKRVRPISEQSTVEYCNYMNRQTERDLLIKELEFMAKTKGVVRSGEEYIDGLGI